MCAVRFPILLFYTIYRFAILQVDFESSANTAAAAAAAAVDGVTAKCALKRIPLIIIKYAN